MRASAHILHADTVASLTCITATGDADPLFCARVAPVVALLDCLPPLPFPFMPGTEHALLFATSQTDLPRRCIRDRGART